MNRIGFLFRSLLALVVSLFRVSRRRYRAARASWFPRQRPANAYAKPLQTCKDIARITATAMRQNRSANIVVDAGGYVYESDVTIPQGKGYMPLEGVLVDDSAYYVGAKFDVRHDGRKSVVNLGRSRPATLKTLTAA